MALLDAATVREYIPSLTGTGEDSQIDSFIARFSGLAAAYMGFPAPTVGGNSTLEVATYTQYFNGPGTKYLHLPVVPVTGITSIHVDMDRKYGSDKLVDSGDYDLYGDEGLVSLKIDSVQGVFDAGRRSIKVVYTAGFSTTPMAIKHACGLQVAYWYSGRHHVGKTSVSQGGTSGNLATLELLPETKQSLNPFRLASSFVG
mgnify:CR=1 FL=1|tara:strand:+ start:1334 stop:1936 length:603 start_codon:yes stop_codon:yes gene_type:complete